MDILPEIVVHRLMDPVFQRKDTEVVTDVLESLGVNPGQIFTEFYTRYVGPFGSKNTGFELLDMASDDENIKSNTELCRTRFSFPRRYLVISGLLGGSVLVYDTVTDGVLNIDFEGGERDLVSGKGTPEWGTFFEFLEQFFR
jgi:hypothetical protein